MSKTNLLQLCFVMACSFLKGIFNSNCNKPYSAALSSYNRLCENTITSLQYIIPYIGKFSCGNYSCVKYIHVDLFSCVSDGTHENILT